MRLIKAHVCDHDIGDVLEQIVVPANVQRSPAIAKETFNLFDDCRKLTTPMVAESNAW